MHPVSRPRVHAGGVAILIINPSSDEDFARVVRDLASEGGGARELQERLRAYHPQAVVRPRGLSGESEAWYVYRDGRWVSGRAAQEG